MPRAARSITSADATSSGPICCPPRPGTRSAGQPGRDPQDIDISEVHRLVDAGTAPSRVAEFLGTSSEHVRFAIDQRRPAGLDAPRRSRTSTRANHPKSTRFTEQFLREEHVRNRKPSHQIAQETGYTHAHIQERLRRFGLTQSKADRAHINEDWLREQYLVLGRTKADIAAELGCCYPHVARSLKRLGIPTRARQRNLEIPARSPAILAPALRRLEGPDRLRLFDFTMRHDSIRDAAVELGVTESDLGQRLRLLEREFGQPLFIRAFSG